MKFLQKQRNGKAKKFIFVSEGRIKHLPQRGK
jgi:hypothetical protein